MLTQLIIVGLGGFVGAIIRFTVSGLLHNYYKGSFALGTFVVNVIGCFTIGALMFLLQDKQLLTHNTRLFLVVGGLGALTTFSTFGYETLSMLQDGNLRLALLNAGTNVFLGIGAVAFGGFLVKILAV